MFCLLGPILGQSVGVRGSVARLEQPGSVQLCFTFPCHSPATEGNISICYLQVHCGSAAWLVLPPPEGRDACPAVPDVEHAASVLQPFESLQLWPSWDWRGYFECPVAVTSGYFSLLVFMSLSRTAKEKT